MARTPKIMAADLIRLLKQNGSEHLRSKGSHQIFKYRTTGKMTVVPMHLGDLCHS